MPAFAIRALEIHSQYAWDFAWVSKAIRFMKAHSLNTLVLHRNDFLDLVVYPGKYFGCERKHYNSIFERYQDIFRKLYKFTPTRRSGPYQRRAYFKRVLEEARRAGIAVYIENKELYFPDIILEFFPQLVKEGKICATDPFWWDFTRVKYTEFFDEFPDVSGIISALATGESRVSIASNRCTCERCRATHPEDWYRDLIGAMHEPIFAAGRKLIIRDFVFSSKAHAQIANTMTLLPESIGVALKNTPHDYYPTFPNNARIGAVGSREQWVEYDVWGQYFGWGIAPSIMINDLRDRMNYAAARGATGVMFRTDWESLDGHSSWDTLNQINLHAGSALAVDGSTGNAEIYARWLEESGYFQPDLDEGEKAATVAWLGSILDQTWTVVKQTCFVSDCVFSDSSHLPVSMDHAYWLAEEKNSLKEWVPAKASALSSEPDNLKTILGEKDDALILVKRLAKEIALGNTGLTSEANQFLRDSFDVFVLYVEAFRIAVHCIFLAQARINPRSSVDKNYLHSTTVSLQGMLREMTEIIGRFEQLFVDTSYAHRVYSLLDADRLKALYADITREIDRAMVKE